MASSLRAASLLVAAALTLGGCGDEDASAPSPAADEPDPASPGAGLDSIGDGGSVIEGEASIAIADFAFSPATVTVVAGTTVRWTNEDAAPHSIDGLDLGFESSALDGGESYDVVYDEVGNHPYVCGIHDYMEGTVTVE